MSLVSGTTYGMPASRILRLARTSRCAMVVGRDQECARDLVGLEAAERAQRQRDLRLQGQRRMAAGEDQPKAVVGNLAGVVVRLFDGPDPIRRRRRIRAFPRRPVCRRMRSMALWRAVWMIQARGKLGDAGVSPLIDGGGKGFLRRTLRPGRSRRPGGSGWRRSGPSRSDRLLRRPQRRPATYLIVEFFL